MFSEDVGNFLTHHLGSFTYVVLAFSLFLIVPPLLLWAFVYVVAKRPSRRRDGLLLGFAVAAWASLCWLMVPYCGAYPCLPAVVLVTGFGASQVDALWKELLVHTVNFLMWPGAGWLLCHVRQWEKRESDHSVSKKGPELSSESK